VLIDADVVPLAQFLGPHFTVFTYDRRGGAKAGTPRHTRSLASWRISMRSSLRLVEQRLCSVIPQVRFFP
jgi:hypothetical protein